QTLSAWTAILDAGMLGVQENRVMPFAPVEMDQNIPNPFHENTAIHFDLTRNSVVSLYVTDLLGQKVAVLYENQKMDKGGHDYIFNARAAGLPQGIYNYSLESERNRVTRKMSVY
ncbi:MAG TPA: T9SS type A sorting domain-containing protein, partial [Bacteroidia bacterium]|nr:T9SS type A sorting domain-containing protein [Bacteroidia bacterium]